MARDPQIGKIDLKTFSIRSIPNGGPAAHSLAVLLAKEKFLKQKLSDLEQRIIDEPRANKKLTKSRATEKEQLLSDLAKLSEQIRAKKAESEGVRETKQPDDLPMDDEDDEDNEGISEDLSQETDSDAALEAPTETEVLETLAQNESSLEQLRREEEILREELARVATAVRRNRIETRVARGNEHHEILAREIVHGLVDPSLVFSDKELLHKFISYQLFVLRKNEELHRKRGQSFGTVALDRLYLNMFSAWKSAGKKSVIVADEDVAKTNYDGVEIQAPEDGSLR